MKNFFPLGLLIILTTSVNGRQDNVNNAFKGTRFVNGVSANLFGEFSLKDKEP